MMINEKRERKDIPNTGFSSDGKVPAHRFIKPDGSLNVSFVGKKSWQQFSIYHYLLSLSHLQFLLIIFVSYTIVNFIFAIIYVAIGVHHLNGIIAYTKLEEFTEAYFFSSQTLTTLGYGRVSPVGFLANIISAIESFLGVIMFALITGLLYGRFTKPRAFIKFSQIALVAPFEDITGLMLRLAPTKSSTISNLKASVTISLNVTEDGVIKNKFLTLPLQISNVMSLALSWTIVHPIDEESPLHGLTKEDILESDAHIMVFVEGFDEGFSNTVVSRTEYLANEIIFEYKFEPMFRYNEKERRNELDLKMINRIYKVKD